MLADIFTKGLNRELFKKKKKKTKDTNWYNITVNSNNAFFEYWTVKSVEMTFE